MGNLDQKNLILAIAISMAIFLGFEFFYNLPRLERERALQAERAQQQASTQVQTPAPDAAIAPTAPGAAPAAAPGVQPRNSVVTAQKRVQIKTARLEGSILLTGARFDDLMLMNYRETVQPGSPPITLLSPQGTANPYFVETGWVPAAGVTVPLPAFDTVWTADRDTLTPAQPVTLSWDNGQGLKFERRIAIDNDYMFTITQRVTNSGSAPVQLLPYELASRTGTPKTSGFFILHEGPLGVFNGKLAEHSYDDVRKQPIEQRSTGGWIGITDKYWLVALVPDPGEEMKARFSDVVTAGVDKYQVDFLGAARTVPPGGSAEASTRVFAGAKEVGLLDRYAAEHNIKNFDLAVDFGWFYFLTKPIFQVLDFFYRWLGNFGLAILLLTVIIKLIFFPLANKSYRAMNKMKLLQPEMEKLRERFGEDKQRLSQEMMALYKREGANPLAGCLPIIIQIPVFFALYKVIFVTIEMRHAPFYGWIKDLSDHDPTSIFNLFGLLPYAPPEIFILGGTLGAWPIIMGATMFLQQKLNPQPPDPVQARVMMAMPFIFTVMLAAFPSGLVIYWAWNNTLSVLQQWVILKQMGHHPPPPTPPKAKT
jgi:YidC/Oxa1 family membrane protein insertase